MREFRGAHKDSTGGNLLKFEQPARRTMLFIAPPGAIPGCLLDAMENEFPEHAIVHVTNPAAACRSLKHPVHLVFLDAAYAPVLDDVLELLASRHNMAGTVLIYDDTWHSQENLGEILAQRHVRGVLPMNLRLDLWLLVIRLLLRGGEYIPPSLVRPHFDGPRKNGVATPLSEKARPMPFGAEAQALNDLTERELQILEMVARGFQNKLIAAHFDLSEHTVKVHLHNIIKKLGTHNRTSAAAMFLANFTTGRRAERQRSDNR